MKKKIVIAVMGVFLLGIVVELFFIVKMIKPQNSDGQQAVNESRTIAQTQTSAVEEDTTQSDEIVKVTDDGVSYRRIKMEPYTALVAVDQNTVESEEKLAQELCGSQGKSINSKDEHYELFIFKLTPLFDDSSITQIEYLLENCPGTFNGSKELDTRQKVNVESTPYSITPSEQASVYFNVYLNISTDKSITTSTEVACVNSAVEAARVRIKLTYADGSQKYEYLGFQRERDYNYSTFQIYKLNYANE